MDRREEKILKDLTSVGGRIADALENVVKLAQEEQEVPFEPFVSLPPFCPVCRKENPTVVIDRQGGQGDLDGWFLEPTCVSCGNKFYAVPREWVTMYSLDDVAAFIAERKAGRENGSNGN